MRVAKLWQLVGVSLAVALSLTVVTTKPVAAAAGFNLTLSPLPINLVTKPGQTVSTPIRIENTGSEAVKLKVSLMKFAANGSGGQPSLVDPTPNDTFIKWASFSQTSFTAQPGVFNTITMTVKPPKEAAFGYYYAVVFSQQNGNQPIVPSENKINGAVASLVLLDVQAPGEKRQLEVVSLKSRHKIYQYLPATFTIGVRNTGNIHVVPTGNVFISRKGSKNFIGTLAINKEQGNVLPKSSRTFTAEWDDGFPSYQVKRQNNQIVSNASGTPVKELDWDLKDVSKFRLGHYTASMTLVYNDGTKDVPVNGEVSFWVIPWIPFLIVVVVLGLVGVGLFVLTRGLLKRTKTITRKSRAR